MKTLEKKTVFWSASSRDKIFINNKAFFVHQLIIQRNCMTFKSIRILERKLSYENFAAY